MLLNICSESQGLERLLSGNELQSLVIATTCLREHSCSFWKEPTFCVLRAISKAQNLGIIQYLQGMTPGDQGWDVGPLSTTRPWNQNRDGQTGSSRMPIYAPWMTLRLVSFMKVRLLFTVVLHRGRKGKGNSFSAHTLSHTHHRAGPICAVSHLSL